MLWGRQSGLTVPVAGPRPVPEGPIERLITEEAALSATAGEDLRVSCLVEEEQLVAQGAPILRLRHHPEIVWTAPMAARVASIDLAPGRRLSEIRLFREDGAGRHDYGVAAALQSDEALRALLLESGLWRSFRSRPFGRTPLPGETPAAIFVAGLDTRPNAPDPRRAVAGLEQEAERGLEVLLRLTAGPVFLCEAADGEALRVSVAGDRLRRVRTAPVHPWGLPGFLIHRHHPAHRSRPVWDIHLEDVAGIGTFLKTGLVPDSRLVSVAGPAATEARLVRCQPGADLRRLSHGRVIHGAHGLLTGSPLDGRRARWLGARDRQVTAMPAAPPPPPSHWLRDALTRASRPIPFIPTAALEHAFGGALPAAAMLRALAVGDRETAIRLGALSFVSEDLALADYVTCASPRHSALLARMLREIAEEEEAAA